MFMYWKTWEYKHLKFHKISIQHNPKQILQMISLDIGKNFLNDMEHNWARWKLV